MKKSIISLLAIVFCLCGCANAQNKNEMKSIVIYFSHAGDNYSVGVIEEGNTKILADHICKQTGADRFEIISEKSYDMPYMSLIDVAKKEQQSGELPAYLGDVDLSAYDVIYLGSPNWWGTYPQVVLSFLSDHDMNGKTIYPFVTHEGSSFGSQLKELKKLYPKSTIKDGLSVAGHDVRSAGKERVQKWLNR